MASPVLTHSDLDSSLSSMQIAETYSGSLPAQPARDAEVAAPKTDDSHMSPESALGGVKGAMVAIGLEAGAVLVGVCLYEIFRHLIFVR